MHNEAVPTYQNFVILGQQVTVTRPGPSQDSATFTFAEDRWPLLNLLRPHERLYDATIRFDEIPLWLRPEVKKFVANRWLRSVSYPKSMHNIMTIFRHMGRILPDFDRSPLALGPKEATQLQQEMLQQNLSADSYSRFQIVLNDFYDFICSQSHIRVPKAFRIEFALQVTRKIKKDPLEVPAEEIVSEDILAQVIDACLEEVNAYYQAKATYIDQYVDRNAYQRQWKEQREIRRLNGLPENSPPTPTLKHLHIRAIKSQAVILAICTGRRSAAYLNLPTNLKMVRVQYKNSAGLIERGVIIRFQEMKTSYVYEDVYCPEEFGDIVYHAVNTIRELTKELRQQHPALQDFLFICPGYEQRSAMIVFPKQLSGYLNGSVGDGRGLLARYQIPCSQITITMLRKTRATALFTGDLPVADIADELGHAYADMSLQHYISGNTVAQKQLQDRMDGGGLLETFSDFCGGDEALF